MNEIDLASTIISEKWFIAFLLLLMLLWAYKLIKWFLCKYLDITKENHILERKGQDNKDVEFLKAIWEIVAVVKEWDLATNNAHDSIHNKLDEIHLDVREVKITINK